MLGNKLDLLFVLEKKRAKKENGKFFFSVSRLDGGVIGGCGEACNRLPGEDWAVRACEIVCDYVGLEAFLSLVEV